MKLSRFYIKPSNNSVYYNERGIITPNPISINFSDIIIECGGTTVFWTEAFDWNRQSPLLTFYANWNIVAAITCKIYRYPVIINNVWNEYMALQRTTRIKNKNIIDVKVINTPLRLLKDKTDVWGDVLETECYAG